MTLASYPHLRPDRTIALRSIAVTLSSATVGLAFFDVHPSNLTRLETASCYAAPILLKFAISATGTSQARAKQETASQTAEGDLRSTSIT